MLSWLVGSMLRRSIKALNEGNVGPALKAYTDDAVLVFPGTSSFGRTYRGTVEVEGFLRRFVANGLQLTPIEITAKGMPWNMRIAMVCTDSTKDHIDGEPVYSNRAVIYCRAAWGKIRYQEDYLDTQLVEAYDAHLNAKEPSAAPA